MKNKLLILFIYSITFIISSSCSTTKKEKKTSIFETKTEQNSYAKNFKITKTDDYVIIDIINPWDSTNLLDSYILIDENKSIPKPEGKIIRTPLKKLIITSAIHYNFLEELNSENIVKGACDIEYIKKAQEKSIKSMGNTISPNIEEIIMLEADAIISDPITGQNVNRFEKSNTLNLFLPDYTELHPLGRAEWLKVYGLLTNKEALADSIFQERVKAYNNIKINTIDSLSSPSIFMDLKYQDSWNIAGGKSYMAQLIKDAGGSYIWKDNESTTFLPLSFEAVFDKAHDADFWLIRYFSDKDYTNNDIYNIYKPYSEFKAFKTKNIFGCNTSKKTFYEDQPTKPHLILKDLVQIFHSNKENNNLNYFSKLN